jgi:hypothetical protein
MIPPSRLIHMLALSGLLGELRPDQLRRLDDDDEPRDEPPPTPGSPPDDDSYARWTRGPGGEHASETSHSRLQAMRANQEIKNERQKRRKLSKRREQSKSRKKK